MITLTRLARGRWTVPAVAGLLIAISFLADRVLNGDLAGDLAMIAAAVVAGTPIVIKAFNALVARVIGIDLLVSVAAMGAVIIGEYWEAAAVTFLFAVGHALEAATLNRTRSALAELVAVAPDVAVDKTGTLTKGRPRLTDVTVLDPSMDRAQVLTWAARAEAGSEHPLARTILDAAAAEGSTVRGLPDHTQPIPGKGITATADGHRILIGNLALLEQYGISDTSSAARTAETLASAGQTPMIVAVDDWVVGVVAVADEVRQDAARMVADLHAAGVEKVVMLTGDARLVAEAVGSATGVDEIRAGLLPEDKLNAVLELQREGHTVAMVGDGVNDAPALATADIGVAMGAAGSAVAVETADIALMGDNLLKLPEAISLARRTVANMRQNITIAVATVALLLLGVLLGGVTMSIGMLVHEVSVLVVIINAMRLLQRTRQHAPQPTQQVPARDRTAHQNV